MKIAASRINAFVKAPDPKAHAILVYGPDSGLVRERVHALMKSVLADLKDPFRVAELSSAMLKDDPARLADEAAALSLTGGRRVVMIQDGADALTPLFKSLLANQKGDALIVVQGGDLPKRSSLRLLFEDADNAAALPCYADDSGSIGMVVTDMLKQAGLTADQDAMAYLTGHLGADRALTRTELTKLILYKGQPGLVTLDDVLACIGDASSLSMDDLALAVADGDQAAMQRILDRLLMEGQHAVGILRGIIRHFQRLHLAAGHMDSGKSAEQAMAALKPPVFFKTGERFRRQLARWNTARLADALEILLDAEIDCKTTGLPAPEMCGRALIRITRAAGKPRR